MVACVAAGVPKPAGDEVHAEIKELMTDVRADGFVYSLATSNDIHQVASGDEHGNIQGSYDYISPEGELIKVSYVANENGYQPDSSVLPTPPPVPAAIIKALEYIRAHPPKDEGIKSHH